MKSRQVASQRAGVCDAGYATSRANAADHGSFLDERRKRFDCNGLGEANGLKVPARACADRPLREAHLAWAI